MQDWEEIDASATIYLSHLGHPEFRNFFFFFEEILTCIHESKQCQIQRPENFMSNHQQNHDNCPLPQHLLWKNDQNTRS